MGFQKVVTKISELPHKFLEEEFLCIDVETTSFDAGTKAFYPYNGHRIAGIGIANEVGDAYYIPLRHTPINAPFNLDHTKVFKWLRKLFKTKREWLGHNLKFDAHFLYQDKLIMKGTYIDTLVLARLVDPIRFSVSLDALCKDYLPLHERKDDTEVKRELKRLGSVNYGDVCPEVLGLYCCQDCLSTVRLYDTLLEQLPEESKQLWNIETKLLKTLFQSEKRGLYIPRKELKLYAYKLLKKALSKQAHLDEINNGEHVDVLSNKQLTHVLLCQSIQPRNFSSKTGLPSWDSDTLR